MGKARFRSKIKNKKRKSRRYGKRHSENVSEGQSRQRGKELRFLVPGYVRISELPKTLGTRRAYSFSATLT